MYDRKRLLFCINNAIENKMIDDSDKIIEEKVNSFRNNLRDIRDRSIAEMIHNIWLVLYINNIYVMMDDMELEICWGVMR